MEKQKSGLQQWVIGIHWDDFSFGSIIGARYCHHVCDSVQRRALTVLSSQPEMGNNGRGKAQSGENSIHHCAMVYPANLEKKPVGEQKTIGLQGSIDW